MAFTAPEKIEGHLQKNQNVNRRCSESNIPHRA
jgi:hypothetical protein